MSAKIRMGIGRTLIGACSTSAWPQDGQSVEDAIAAGVLQVIDTTLTVTIGETTMFLAAWRDPDHWAEDWAKKLGVEWDDVPDAVAAIIQGATYE